MLTVAFTLVNLPLLSSNQQAHDQATRGQVAELLTVYDDQLAEGWEDVSWGSTINFTSTTPVQDGTAATSIELAEAWSALHLTVETPYSGNDYNQLRFWLHGGSEGGQQLRVVLANGVKTFVDVSYPIEPVAGEWTLVELPFTLLGEPSEFYGFAIQDTSGAPQPTFHIDSVQFEQIIIPPTATPTQTSTPTQTPTPTATPSVYQMNVNASEERGPISPEIYGMNFASEDLAEAVRLPVNRVGGNATSRWNWKIDSTNVAEDYYFINFPDTRGNIATLPHGSSVELVVEQNARTGTKTLLTAPMTGWVTKDRSNACAYSVEKYGEQQAIAPGFEDCGNGVTMDGEEIVNNDPTDTSLPITTDFVSEWVTHLTNSFGTAESGGVNYFSLDNEPMLWSKTHRDVHPEPVGYDEIRDRSYAYAAAIKAADPSIQTIGPAVWGWEAYFYSSLDQVGDFWWENPPDRNAHDGLPFLAWYLREMKAYEDANGVRILDYLDIHYYPAVYDGMESVTLAPVGSAETQARRLRSTRSLWDSTYVDESRIGQPIQLIPMMRNWIDTYYPGTKLSISEYNWGGLEHMNGALAQADVLGAFGKHGVDMAMLWDPGPAEQPYAYAFRMYRNYDGQGSEFGDVSVGAISIDESKLSLFAAKRTSDDYLTIMVVNKDVAALNTSFNINGFDFHTEAQAFQYSADNPNEIIQLPNVETNFVGLETTFAAQSITLLVVPPFMPTPTPDPNATATPTPSSTPDPNATPNLTTMPTTGPNDGETPQPSETRDPQTQPGNQENLDQFSFIPLQLQ